MLNQPDLPILLLLLVSDDLMLHYNVGSKDLWRIVCMPGWFNAILMYFFMRYNVFPLNVFQIYICHFELIPLDPSTATACVIRAYL